MPLNKLPLLSVATVKAALEQINASPPASATQPKPDAVSPAQSTPAQSTTVSVEAKVVNVKVQGQQVLLTLEADGKQFQVKSDLPLPIDTKLSLQVTTYTQKGGVELPPEVAVQKIILPENKTTPPTQALIQRFISERLALLEASLQKPAAPKDTYLRPDLNLGPKNTTLNKADQPSVNTTSAPAPAQKSTSHPPALAPQASALRSSELLSSLSLLQPSHRLQPSVPAEVKQVLTDWQQSLPSLQQLTQAEGVKESILRTGVQYEQRVMQLLEQLQASRTTQPQALFKSLWAKTGAAVVPLSQAVTNSIADSTSEALSQRLEKILHSVQTALEKPVPLQDTQPISQRLLTEQMVLRQRGSAKETAETATSDKPSPTPPPLLQTLLGSNHKAIISRALLAWAHKLAEPSADNKQASTSAQSNTGTARSLPLTPQANGPDAFRLLQRTLAGIEHEQIRQLQTNEPWQLSVPLLFKEGQQPQEVRLELLKDNEQDSEAQDGESKETLWRLRLFFDLQHLGNLDADIELCFPSVKVTFWSKRQETLNSLSHALKPLQKRLIALGAEVEDIQVKYGQMPETSRNLINQRLVDAKA